MVIALLTSPILTNAKVMFVYRGMEEQFYNLAEPLLVFSDQIEIQPDTQIFIEKEVFNRDGPNIVKNIDEIMTLVNVILDSNANRDTIVYENMDETILESLLDGDFTYVLLTEGNWRMIEGDVVYGSKVQDIYHWTWDENGKVVLLQLEDGS